VGRVGERLGHGFGPPGEDGQIIDAQSGWERCPRRTGAWWVLVCLGGADVMDGDVDDARAGVGRPASVVAASGRDVVADGQEDGVDARLERDLAGASPLGSFQSAITADGSRPRGRERRAIRGR
jgi:hypothetical protein